jgi:hypothetical protein
MFKSSLDKMVKNKAKIIVPNQFKIMENRYTYRKGLQKEGLKVVLEKVDSEIIGKTSFTLTLIDISMSGIGLKCSVSKAESFGNGEEFVIKKIGEWSLENPIRCKVMHNVELKLGESKLTNLELKIGLSFDKVEKDSLAFIL